MPLFLRHIKMLKLVILRRIVSASVRRLRYNKYNYVRRTYTRYYLPRS